MDMSANSQLSDLSSTQKRALLAELLRKKVSKPQSYPLSFTQQGLWFLYQLTPDNPFYNASCTITITGPLQKRVLEQSLSELVRRHQILRTRFELREEHPVQLIDPVRPIPLPVGDLTLLSSEVRAAEVQRLSLAEARRPFDLAHGSVLRVHLLRLATEKHLLLLSLHHIIADGWSLGVLFRELGALYTAFSDGRPSPLPELALQYTDFALWQRNWLTGAVLTERLTYWKERLADLPPLALPTDRPRLTAQTFAGASEPFSLSPEVTSRLNVLSQREGVTLFMTLQAGFSALLARYSGQDDFGVGTVIANRTRSELEPLIGFFANTLVLRVNLSGDPTVREYLHRIREVALKVYAHQDIPFELLVEELHPQRDLSQNPLIQVVLVLQNAPYEPLEISGLKLHLSLTQNGTSKFDLLFSLWESAGGVSGMVEYNTDLFDASTIRRMVGHYRRILAAMATQPEQHLSMLPLLTEREQEQFHIWNRVERDCPLDMCLHELVEQQAEHVPDAVALVFEGKQCTYSELNTRANQLAHFLQQVGVGPDVPVGICLERSIELIIGVLGILKAGGAYAPLDPAYPQERLAFILADTRAPVLITQQSLAGRLPDGDSTVLFLDTAWQTIVAQNSRRPASHLHGANLAYIIYTSGSTGTPKGIAMPHAALVNVFIWQQRSSQLSLGARTLQFASMNFDVAPQEIFCTLGFGQTLVLLSEGLRRDPVAMLTLVIDEAIERLFVPVVVLQQLAECAVADGGQLPVSLREVVTAGEQLQITAPVASFFESVPICRLHNEYGPSECHAVSSYMLTGTPQMWPPLPPIGCPIDNTKFYVLDKHLQLVPVGIPGELYIGGRGLARGYLARPDLTAERFVPHPFASSPGERLYRTGDLTRYLPDGNLQFLGRIDHQVKIRGYRIELGEIETILSRHPAVRTAVVLVREEAAAKYLVAYVTPSEISTPPSGTELRQYLQRQVPEYMLPAHILVLDQLPLTRNGKLDRQALPLPEAFPGNTDVDSAAASPLEEILAGMWASLLGRSQVGRQDNFFELGGHSLLATRLVSRLRTSLQVALPLHTLFEHPTIAQLAPQLEQLRWREAIVSELPLRAVAREQVPELPLSFAQQRLWFLEQLSPDSAFYTIPALWRLQGRLHPAALIASVQALLRRHESLRTSFVSQQGQPVQRIAAQAVLPLLIVDLRAVAQPQRVTLAQQVCQQLARRPFDLERGPLLRACLLQLGEEEHWLLLSLHHIITDGWSMNILWRDLAAGYRAALTRESVQLPALPVQYADYALWQREWLQGEVLRRQLAYWQERLQGAQTLMALPSDHPRPAVQRFRGASHAFTLSRELTRGLWALSRGEEVTLFMTLLAGFAVLLSRYSGQRDLVIGMPIANRTREEIEEVVGCFANVLPLRFDLSGNPRFRDLLRRVRELTLQAYVHQDLPFEQLVEVLQLERDLSRNPLFQVTFQTQNVAGEPIELAGLNASPLLLESEIAKFDLSLYIEEDTTQLSGILEYSTDLFEPSTSKRMIGHYLRLLEGIVAQPEQRLSHLPLLTDAEQMQLGSWNTTQVVYPRDACLHTLFEEQVKQRPDTVALVFEPEQVTYHELNMRANKLASFLRAAGVGPEVLVGMCIDRSLEMMVALLAILKAGGAYLPLDARYPIERIAFMLTDARVSILLTQEHLLEQLSGLQVARICLEQFWAGAIDAGENSPTSIREANAENLAYVMYTSGSTGTSKGVSITHRNVTRLVKETNYASLTAEEIFLQFAPISFDASTFEIWGALLNGGRLIGMAKETALDPQAFAGTLRRHQVTTLFVTTALFNQCVKEVSDIFQPLRQILFGGEAVDPQWVREALVHGAPERLLHVYGPTENTTFSSWYLVHEVAEGAGTVPIGRPIANTQLYVLDQCYHPVPVGVRGELYVGGDGLARDYLNRPDLTAEKFVPDPFSTQPGARLYRTGDYGCYRSDGHLEFLGRSDRQVKLRGHRIELDEIEAVLRHHPALQEAVALLREDASGDKQLIAYVVAQREQIPTTAQLRQHLAQRLPEYMLPAHILVLDQLPLTRNGKLDRQALPLPEALPGNTDVDSAAASPLEEILAGMWASLLGRSQVGRQDNFFELGGHSLLATRLVSRLRTSLQVALPLHTLFEHPTIAQLAPQLEQLRWREAIVSELPLRAVAREQVPELPLSFAQQRLWFLEQLSPDSAFYTIPALWRLQGSLHPTALIASVQALLRRHESLRTSFVSQQGQPVQRIAAQVALPLLIVDLRTVAQPQRVTLAQQVCQQLARRPFDLERGPLLRACLLQLGEEEHWLLLSLHHIITDGWSMNILWRELAAGYRAALTRESVSLPALPVQYADYALWQREWLQGEVLARQLAYWQEQLQGAQTLLALPSDHPRPAVQRFRGASHAFTLSKELTRGLWALSRGEEVTLFMTLLAGFAVLLSRYSGQRDLVIGMPIANRAREEIEEVVGFFVNTLPLRLNLSSAIDQSGCGELSVRGLLKRVREVALAAYAHQDLPFERLVDALHLERDLSYTPLFQVMFALQNEAPLLHDLPELSITALPVESGVARFDLTLFIEEGDLEVSGAFEYNLDLFEPATIERLAKHLQVLLEGMVANPDQPIVNLPLLAAEERQQMLVDWNETRQEGLADICLPQLLEKQAERIPEAIALVYEEMRITYSELHERANQLAHYLRRLGVGPERTVGLWLDRSPEMVIAVLAVLKAGGAYVPFDPSYPRQRLTFMLVDARVSVLLTYKQDVTSLADHGATIVPLEDAWSAILQESTERLDSEIRPAHLAYIIYTSGSTGQPKGVMITHGGLVNYLSWCVQAYDMARGYGSLLHSSLAFDLSVTALFAPLLTGKILKLLPEEKDINALGNALQKSRELSLVKLTPTHLSLLTQQLENASIADCTSAFILGGEALLYEHIAFWRERMPHLKLFNEYGPTETVVGCCVYELPDGAASIDKASIPIGRPIANSQLYILDAQLQPVPIGVIGELYIGGAGVARGYWQRPELTAERFLPDLFSSKPGARFYRSGDLARYLPDGIIEYLGRNDQQVKLRGYRIEPGEVEAVLYRHPAVQEAAVLLREDHLKRRQLVAYVVPQQSVSRLTNSDLRHFLEEQLPNYMVPTAFIQLEALPLTPGGKVDQRVLPAPVQNRLEWEHAHTAPQTPTEEALLRIWSDVLKLEQIGIHDNFFELGGDSILSLQIVARATAIGLPLTPRLLFQQQTIAQLAAVIGATSPEQTEQDSVAGPVPLTPILHWFFEQNQPVPRHWNQALLLEMRQPLNPSVLQRSLQALLIHHDMLLLRAQNHPDGWRLFIAEPDLTEPVSIVSIDLSSLPVAEQNRALEEAASSLQASLHLADGPLLRAAVFQLRIPQPDRLLLVIHHLAIDIVSWSILLEDLQSAYRQLSQARSLRMPAKTTSFRRWAERLNAYAQTPALCQQMQFWLSQPWGEVHPLPRDYSAELNANTEGSAQTVSQALSAEETHALLFAVPKAYRTQINEVLLAALVMTFARWTGQQVLLVHLEGHGREDILEEVELSRTVGWFTALIPLVLSLGNKQEPGEILKHIKEQLRRVPNNGLGFGLLRYLSLDEGCQAQLAALPHPEVSFNYAGRSAFNLAEDEFFSVASEATGASRDPRNRRVHVLDCNGSIIQGQLYVEWTYSNRFHARATIERLARGYLESLRELIEHCQSPQAGGFTPSDFPEAGLTQTALDAVLATVERIIGEPIGAQSVEAIYPLSSLQEGMLFHSLYHPRSAVYIEQIACTFHGNLDIAAFKHAWQQVIAHHSVLRTLFLWEQLETLLQVVLPQIKLPWTEEQWCDLAASEQDERIHSWLYADRVRGFDLSQAPLFRLNLIHLSENVCHFTWSFHHLLLDGWSTATVLGQVFACYNALRQHQSFVLPASRPYRDYIGWLGRQKLAQAERFWRQHLQGFTTPTSLAVRRPAFLQGEEHEQYDEQKLSLVASTTTALQEFARREQLTLNTLVQGAWALLLSHYSGAADVVFGVTVSGRPAELVGSMAMVGLFINTLPLRASIDPRQPLTAWLRHLQRQQAETRQYEYSPLVQVQSWSEVPRGQPLFESVLIFENYPVDASLEHIDGLEIRDVLIAERTNYPLTLTVAPGPRLLLRIGYMGNHFEDTIIQQMSKHLQMVLEAMIASPEQRLENISLLTDAERQQMLVAFHATSTTFSYNGSISDLFEEQVARTPDAVALIFAEQHLTYDELNRRANYLAHYLKHLGVEPETLVALCLERSLELLIGLLGILKAGGAYVPLDPSYPKERLDFMLADIQMHRTGSCQGQPLLLTQQSLLAVLPSARALVVLIDAQWAEIIHTSEEHRVSQVQGDHLAYVIYTSGSTGQPKGVQVRHWAVVNFLVSMQRLLGLQAHDILLAITTLSFDIAVLELFLPLCNGARTVMLSRKSAADGNELAQALQRSGATFQQATPMSWRLLLEAGWAGSPHLKMLCGGEALTYELADRLLPGGAELWNLYGPTETTIWSTAQRVQQEAGAHSGLAAPIGRPIANTQIYLLDRYLRPVPVGVPGELYIGGAGLARGYLNRPDLTAERFIPHPWSEEPGARLYWTGDLGRYLSDGTIEFLGRNDLQVKIRGYRIELAEIEAALAQHPAVQEGIVVVREMPVGEKRLVAYVILREKGHQEPVGENAPIAQDKPTLTLAALRAFLREKLPDYMLPSAMIRLPALPLLSGGKVDRRHLPSPDDPSFTESDQETEEDAATGPRTPVEEVLAGVWEEVLGLKRVRVFDNFFERGGHSLFAIRVISRVRSLFQVDLAVMHLFEAPTVAGLAEVLLKHEVVPGQITAIAKVRLKLKHMSADEVHEQLSQMQKKKRE